jgi:hypothetical protein
LWVKDVIGEAGERKRMLFQALLNSRDIFCLHSL